VVGAIVAHNIVSSLRTSTVAHHEVSPSMLGKGVHDGAFA
jgi:hypothetical protein